MLSAGFTDSALRSFDHYDIDLTDPKYRPGRVAQGPLCSFCHRHSARTPTAVCDLEQARARDMESHGFDASCCFHCRKAFPRLFNRTAICPRCQRIQDEQDAQISRQLRNRRRTQMGLGTTTRVDDGVGCTERLPDWSVDWDGNPGHQEMR